MKRSIFSIILFTICFCAFAAADDGIKGVYSGKLDAMGTKMQLIFRLEDNSPRLDSPNQNVYGIPMVMTYNHGDSVCVEVPSLKMKYCGKLQNDQIKGTFEQGPYTFPLDLTPYVDEPKVVTPVADWSVKGDFAGIMDAMGTKMKVVVRLDPAKPRMDSPNQNVYGIPMEVVYNREDSICVEIPSMMVKYTGRYHDGEIKGTFQQGPYSFPLDLTPYDENASLLKRPQTPVQPLPYTTEELAFQSLWDGATLTGTLSLAENPGDSPLVVMVSGSGQQDRDEGVFEHRPFFVIADYLARNGISSFRYDDRGVGSSEGLRADITTQTNKEDAVSALRMLRDKGIAGSYGVLGHSEGGTIAFMAASQNPDDVDFIISLAGTGVSGDSILMYQNRLVGTGESDDSIRQRLKEACAKNQWLDFFCSYDPGNDIRQVYCPVMAVNGSMDHQVEPTMNLMSIRFNLDQKPEDFIKEYPGLNHLFQHCTTGSPTEYIDIEETISEEVLQDMVRWIQSLMR